MKIDLEKIRHLYIDECKTAQEIANIFNITYGSIRYIMYQNNITRKKDTRRKKLDKNILYNLYVIQKKSKPEIMNILKCCKITLDKNLKYYNIKTPYDNYSDNDLIKMYNSEFKSLTQISNITKVPKSRIRNILIKNKISLRDKSSCQCINIDNKDAFKNFDFSVLKSQSTIKRRSQSFFKNHISKNLKIERGNKCEKCGCVNNLHIHHLKPLSIILSTIIKENPDKTEEELYNIIIKDERYLDKTNMIVVCEKCHYTIYHPYIKYHVNQQPSSE